MPLARKKSACAVGAVTRDVGDVDARLGDEQLGLLGLGELADVLDQAREAQRLLVHRREVGPRVGHDAVLRGLDARDDPGDRRAQLVGDVGGRGAAQLVLAVAATRPAG